MPHLFLSTDEIDDWDAADVRPKQGRVENLLYLNDEDEEEGDDPEQEHDGRKVMVRRTHPSCCLVF